MQNYLQSFKIIILGLVLAIGISYAFAAPWAGPSGSPPNLNAEAPINVGGATQTKSGPLNIIGIFETYNDTYLATVGGRVGIGTASPTEALDVVGKINASDDITTSGGVIIGNTTSATAGTIRWTGTDFEGYIGSGGWKSLTIDTTGGGGVIPPVDLPTVSLSVTQDANFLGSTIPIEYPANIAWEVTGATNCDGFGGGSTNWNITSKSITGGNETVTPNATADFTLTCANSAGPTSAVVTINVLQWENAVGIGALGESCNNWLIGTNQAGYAGTVMRFSNTFFNNPYTNDYCLYETLDCTDPYGGCVWAGTKRQSDFARFDIRPAGEAIDSYNGSTLSTQTRRQ